jgi:hypothetical protein
METNLSGVVPVELWGIPPGKLGVYYWLEMSWEVPMETKLKK